ncbi:hypothetical protein [Pelagicoccus sp. SDUM812005]|uniref:tetratricopeptide repeat protein n=1 Tax=Pelagicoccus sp. SDUM812005 TaxID=3041257 RepID=UPI00281060CB|nr:hypothetical protein [Pelagicoccus sp. SDUM812005]MDQ8179166.1 hypothetical protein [Pelagicoccus sp. SDUM812005]
MKSTRRFPLSPRFGKLAAAAVAWLAPLVSGLHAQDPTPINSETIDLKPFEVKAKRVLPKNQLLWAFQKKEWQYAQLGDFEILSYAWEGNAERYLKDFQRFRDALSIAWPIPLQPLVQNTIILCGADKTFDEFTPAEKKQRNGIFSHLFYDGEKAAIVLDLQKSFYDAELQNHFVRLEVDHRRLLYREYIRLLYAQSRNAPPPWLIEGNTQIIMDMDVYDRIIKFGFLDVKRGRPSPDDIPDSAKGFLQVVDDFGTSLDSDEIEGEGDVAETDDSDPFASDDEEIGEGTRVTLESVLPFWTADPPFHIALANKSLIPLEEMFAFSPEQYRELNPLVDMAWAKQAHAFVHYCKFGADRKHEQAFQTFVQRISKEPLTEELFQECFQMSYDGMLEKLSGHIRYPYHKYNYYKLYKDQGITAEKVTFREPSPNEVGRIVGTAQLAAGKVEEAISTFRETIERLEPLTDSPSPELLSSLAQAELQAGLRSSARERLEAAAQSGSRLPSTWTTLARLRFEELKTQHGPDGQIPPDALAKVLVPLLMARKLEPAVPETYELMAAAWQRSAIPPNLVQVDLLSEGVVKFPYNTRLGLQVAQFYLRANSPENAQKCADFALRHCADPLQRSQLSTFLRNIETTGQSRSAPAPKANS